MLNQPYIQLLWRYYKKNGSSSNRDELGVDDIYVESKRVLSGSTVAGVSTVSEGVLYSGASVVSSSNVLYVAKRFIELNRLQHEPRSGVSSPNQRVSVK